MKVMTVENVINWSDAEIISLINEYEAMFASGYDLKTGEMLTEEEFQVMDRNYSICEDELNRRRVGANVENPKEEKSAFLNPLLLIDDDIYEDAGIQRRKKDEEEYCI